MSSSLLNAMAAFKMFKTGKLSDGVRAAMIKGVLNNVHSMPLSMTEDSMSQVIAAISDLGFDEDMIALFVELLARHLPRRLETNKATWVRSVMEDESFISLYQAMFEPDTPDNLQVSNLHLFKK